MFFRTARRCVEDTQTPIAVPQAQDEAQNDVDENSGSDGETSNHETKTRDRASTGQTAPAEDIAQRLYASETMVEREGYEPLGAFGAQTLETRVRTDLHA